MFTRTNITPTLALLGRQVKLTVLLRLLLLPLKLERVAVEEIWCAFKLGGRQIDKGDDRPPFLFAELDGIAGKGHLFGAKAEKAADFDNDPDNLMVGVEEQRSDGADPFLLLAGDR